MIGTTNFEFGIDLFSLSETSCMFLVQISYIQLQIVLVGSSSTM